MAGGTRGGPAGCYVIRIRGPVEIRLVAGVTRCRGAGKHVIDMAADAIDRDVRTG